MDKLSQALIPLFAIGLTLWLFSTLAPLYAEWSGNAEEEIQAKLDAESCASYTPLYINHILFCQCSDNEKQKPGKCSEKYND